MRDNNAGSARLLKLLGQDKPMDPSVRYEGSTTNNESFFSRYRPFFSTFNMMIHTDQRRLQLLVSSL